MTYRTFSSHFLTTTRLPTSRSRNPGPWIRLSCHILGGRFCQEPSPDCSCFSESNCYVTVIECWRKKKHAELACVEWFAIDELTSLMDFFMLSSSVMFFASMKSLPGFVSSPPWSFLLESSLSPLSLSDTVMPLTLAKVGCKKYSVIFMVHMFLLVTFHNEEMRFAVFIKRCIWIPRWVLSRASPLIIVLSVFSALGSIEIGNWFKHNAPIISALLHSYYIYLK